MRMEMRRALRMANQAIRANSICPVCGKPREGFQVVTGGRWHGTGQEGVAAHTGGQAQTREQAGLCTCGGEQR